MLLDRQNVRKSEPTASSTGCTLPLDSTSLYTAVEDEDEALVTAFWDGEAVF